MTENDIIAYIRNACPKAESVEAFGYLQFFFGSERKLPFATLLSRDTDYDNWSDLARDGDYRLNIGIGPQALRDLIGGEVAKPDVNDLTARGTIMPHPEYRRQGYVCVVSPGSAMARQIEEMLTTAYQKAAGGRGESSSV